LITQMNQHRRLLVGVLYQIKFTTNNSIIVINRHNTYINVMGSIYATNQVLSKLIFRLSQQNTH